MKKNWKKWVLAILVILIATIAIGGLAVSHQVSQIINTEMPRTEKELSISPKASELDEETINIAIFGIDTRDQDLEGRSDTILLLSIEWNRDQILLSSIMRDTYVEVPDYGWTKINHAYGYGGPVLAVRTLNSNFNLNVRDYVSVDLGGFEKIVDLVGGVEVTIKDYEVPVMKNVGIDSAGSWLLSGKQALKYAKIRKVGDADFERTQRQQTVLLAIFGKVRSAGITKYPALVAAALPNLETSLSQQDILRLGMRLLSKDFSSIQQARFPSDEDSQGQIIDGVYYLVTDLESVSERLHQYIYEEPR